ncbi:MAG: hypothetical protein WCW33_03960 [Candidatus Babeliales bacterium]|jgi:hypothetical protein
MKKILQVLAVAALVTGTSFADDHTNKTFLMPRPQGVNLPMETTTYEEELIPRKLDDKFGATFQLVPFFQQSNDHDDTAEYFLIHHKDKITLQTDTVAFAGGDTSSVTNDIDINYLYHQYNHNHADGYQYGVNVSLDPEQTVYGARMDYYQNLGVILKNLYLKIDAPIVHVENDPELLVDGAFAGANAGVTTAQITDRINHYLQGTFEKDAEFLLTQGGGNVNQLTNLQTRLTHAKIVKRSAAGVADVDVALGYKFINTEKYLLGLAFGVTAPAGNKANGEYMFEPIVGNGQHWGIGGDLYGSIRAWGKIKHNLKFFLRMKYRYLLENSENRTLGIQGYDWGQYMLLGRATPVAGAVSNLVAYRSLVPAANVTTLRVDVTPGSQFDGILGMTYNNGGFSFDLGYNLYYREAESVHRKDHLPASTYFVAARNLNTALAGDTRAITNSDVDEAGAAEGAANVWYVDDAHLDLSVAETPSQFTNSIYGGMGYQFRKWEVPMMMGIGGKYEFASENSALEQWSIWGKMGVTF